MSFRGQPALPTTSGAAAGGSVTPTIGGAGKAPLSPLQATKSGEVGETTFADLSGALSAQGSQSGDAAPGEGGPAVGAAAPGLPSAQGELAGITFSGNPFGGSARGPGGVGLTAGPTGRVSFTSGNAALDHALSMASNAFGVPMGINALTALAGLVSSPVASILGAAVGPAAMPFAMIALAHQFAQGMPTSVTSMQNALAEINPEMHLTEAQAQQIMEFGAKAFQGPMSGGPQAIGNMPFDNPVTNVPGSTQAGPTAPAANLAEAGQLTPTFADLAHALGFGTNREDAPPGAPNADPNADAAAAAATASATAGTGVSSSTGSEGAPAGSPDGPSGAAGDL